MVFYYFPYREAPTDYEKSTYIEGDSNLEDAFKILLEILSCRAKEKEAWVKGGKKEKEKSTRSVRWRILPRVICRC